MAIDWQPHVIRVLKKLQKRPEGDQLAYDGWSIFATSHFTEMGFDEKFLKPMIHRHPSLGGKHNLFDNDGKFVDYIDGIYYLTFLEKVAKTLNPEFYTKKMGRGFRAGECLEEIDRCLKKPVSLSEG